MKNSIILIIIFSSCANALLANLVSAQGSGFFDTSSYQSYTDAGSPPCPPVPADQDYWSGSSAIIHCTNSGSSWRFEIEFDNTANPRTCAVRYQTGGVLVGWTTQDSVNSAQGALSFVFHSYRFYFGVSTAETFDGSQQEGGYPCVALGFDGGDTLIGTSGADFLFGGEGEDTIYGGDGRDELWGGPSADDLYGEGDFDMLYMGDGGGEAYGGTGGDIIMGGNAEDTLCGYLAAADEPDVLGGEADDDVIVSVGGGDSVWGGPGEDQLWIFSSVASISVHGGGGADKIFLWENFGSVWGDYETASGDDEAADLVYVWGSHSNGLGYDITLGGGNDIVFNGSANADTMLGNGGDDTMNGGSGTDVLKGHVGEDKIWANDGGTKSDAPEGGYNYAYETVEGGDNNDQLWGGQGCDDITGGSGDDRMAGDDGTDSSGDDDKIEGGDNNDVIWGENGKDVLIGDEGADKISGGSGPDCLWSYNGDDILVDRSDGEIDELKGGKGNDTLDSYNGPQTGPDGMTIDLILGDNEMANPQGEAIANSDIFYADDRDNNDYDSQFDGSTAWHATSDSGIDPHTW
ncbi:MAG: calcium-binding protein [Planctomycetes bacterium]|nr:calcium-binding protein [Planctomycetota bacterium]